MKKKLLEVIDVSLRLIVELFLWSTARSAVEVP